MPLKQQFAHILAAAFVIAALALPSVALAHDGHAQPPAVGKATATSPDGDISKLVPVASSSERGVSVVSTAPVSAAADAPRDCGGSCCCGAALAPSLFETPPYPRSVPFVVSLVPSAHGLPPEALPKPPKSFA